MKQLHSTRRLFSLCILTAAVLCSGSGLPVAEAAGNIQVQIHNDSDIEYHLQRMAQTPGLDTPNALTLPAHQTVLLQVQRQKDHALEPGPLGLLYQVTNLLAGPNEPLKVELVLNGTTIPAKAQ